MLAIDKDKNISCGSSSSGLPFKIPGRVGHSAIVGAAAYCINDIGAAASTGNGDILQRFMVSQRAVEVSHNTRTYTPLSLSLTTYLTGHEGWEHVAQGCMPSCAESGL